MRFLAAVLILLAGCAAPAPPQILGDAVTETNEAWSRVLLLDATVAWHDQPDPTIGAYNQIAQPLAHPCLYNDATTIYFTNQILQNARAPNGTTSLAVTFDWDEATYTRDALRVAYLAPDATHYVAVGPAPAGQEMQVPVEPGHWSASGAIFGPSFELWACVDNDRVVGEVPAIFRGTLHYRVEAVA